MPVGKWKMPAHAGRDPLEILSSFAPSVNDDSIVVYESRVREEEHGISKHASNCYLSWSGAPGDQTSSLLHFCMHSGASRVCSISQPKG
jgi:hypothetical protein